MVTDRRTDRRTDGRTDGQTDRRNDKPSTVTLAAHARRGLIIVVLMAIGRVIEQV